MLIIAYILLAVILGVIAGTFTGLSPGIHINLVSLILLGFSAALLNIVSPLVLVSFIIAMAITHTFTDFITSILLGAPDEDSFLSILPGHQFLLKGKAYHAIIITAYGSIFALLIILLFTPLFIFTLPKIYPYVVRIMPIILILISGFLIFTEKNKKLWAIIIFLLAGFLGIASLNLNLKEPLLPLLTGLFGASNLIISLKQKTQIPKQEITSLKKIKLNKKSLIKSISASIIASPFMAVLPGLGSSQAALIGNEVIGELDQKEFLFLLGAINTIVMGLSFVVLYSIQKTRTGAAVAVSKLIETFTLNTLLIILAVIIVSGILAFFITVYLSKIIIKKIHKINYSKLSIIILLILILVTIYFSGWLGFLVMIISISLGITTILLGVKRIHLMGCLLVPTILFYLL